MSKREAPAPEKLPAPAPVPNGTGALVAQNVQALVSENPDAIGFDMEDPANELLALRCMTDPGIAAQLRDGWRGIVTTWYIGTWQAVDGEKGELLTLPSLVLLTSRDEIVRLTGWPCISSWANLLRAAGAERVRQGLPVRISRRASGTAGRSYWIVLPDSGEKLAGE